MLKVLIFNTFSVPLVSPEPGRRLHRIGKKIKEINPDLVFLQEIYTPWHKNLIATSLTNYSYKFIPRDGIFNTGGGLLFFSKVPIEEKELHPFSISGNWFDLSLFDKMAKKGFMKLKLALPQSVYFFHTHITANYDNNFSSHNRYGKIIERQFEELSEEVQKISLMDLCFVVGDLNVPPSQSMLKNFLKKIQSKDLLVESSPTIKRNLYLLPIPIYFEKVDYFLLRGSSKIKYNVRYIFEEDNTLSDHVGILAEIEI